VSYNESVVKIYKTTNSLARLEIKEIFFCFEKRYGLLHTALALWL
jgi:hypothetical protein